MNEIEQPGGMEIENAGCGADDSRLELGAGTDITTAARLAGIGSVDFWMNHPGVTVYTSPGEGRIALTADQVKSCVREGLANARKLLPDRSADSREVARECVGKMLENAEALSLHRVINATGVILHTNLGRAPMHPEIVRLATEVVSGYTNLEMSIESGERSRRLAGLEAMLIELSGAEDALAVNNCAAALFLILSALAGNPYEDGQFLSRPEIEWHRHPNEVVISRGELVQIGGGFRIPRILEASSAMLREVGTTNITLAEDYERAMGDNTAMILKAHRSNFSLSGFTNDVPPNELAEMAHKAGVPFVCDIGSATMIDERFLPQPLRATPTRYLRAGADIVCFSGDKLLGGPQAGIVLGRKAVIDRLRKHPIMRTLRLDKWTGALLSALLWALGNERIEYLPVVEMLTRDAALDKKRARAIARRARSPRVAVEVVRHDASVGGGSLPGETLESFAVAIRVEGMTADETAERFRRMKPPVIGVVQEDRFLMNMRTVLQQDEKDLARMLAGM
jgi:L-seryl-tRNA(Ser) seleniumtransferase